ncbi:acetoacetate decarboxylase family protein [Massilia terrae]|uniref:Acetoacetate decarboxylase (ADC) n=1 Tax=Massilia terrae TaxID=1811224 RepID=A0ABT2D196_9BURK|nr:acetoacetate decarboxylase (ADC) [Massilia terrae]MCS0659195.1 acetoacetate decarboxylase (ADC) [Massilia terrae]
MTIRNIGILTGLLSGGMAMDSMAQNPAITKVQANKIIEIAGNQVPVVSGGLYDRYRSNPPLSVIENEAPDVDLSWFRTLKKTKVDVGFETYSPNFYYKDSRITAIFTADINKLRELIPPKIGEQIQPLQIWPGRGVIALTAYAYHYCDNDSYTEISLSIVTNKPGSASFGPLTLLGQSMSKSFWGYILKLPVNTELARVRGVVGYNLPKWLTEINFEENETAIKFEIMDKESDRSDVVFEGKKLKDLSKDVELITNSFTNVNQNGKLTYGYAISRQLSHATSTDPDSAMLRLGDGALSNYIKSLKLGKLLKYEYVPEFQSALYAPQPLPADR